MASQEMKDEFRYMGTVAVALTGKLRIHPRYLSPESITDRSDLGFQVRKRESLTIHMDSHYAYTSGMSTV